MFITFLGVVWGFLVFWGSFVVFWLFWFFVVGFIFFLNVLKSQ